MTGLINKTARQLDLRSRDSSGIIHVVLNPGFNIVDDETWAALLENKHNKVLVDEGAIIEGASRTKADVEAQQEIDARNAELDTVAKPNAAASVVKTEGDGEDGEKDPNIDPKTGKPYTKAQLKKLADAKGATDLDL